MMQFSTYLFVREIERLEPEIGYSFVLLLEKRLLVLSDSLFLTFVIEPALAPAIDPKALSLDAMLVQIVADAALFAAIPATLILAPITPYKSTLAVPLVLLELPLVLLAIRPPQVPMSMHFIVEPLTVVLLIVAPEVDPLALDLVHLKLPCVNRPVGERQLPLAVLLPLEVLALVDGAIRPRLQPEPMLLVVLPAAHILRSVSMSVSSMTVRLIIDPVAFINVPIGMVQLTLAISLALAPLALISAPIEPFLLALAVAHIVEPLALVNGARVEVDGPLDLADALAHIHHVLVIRVIHIDHSIGVVPRLVVKVGILALGVVPLASIIHVDVLVHLVLRQSSLHFCSIDAPDGIRRVVLSRAIGKNARAVSHFVFLRKI